MDILTSASRTWEGAAAFYWKYVAPDLQRARHNVRKSDRWYLLHIKEARKSGDHKSVEDLEAEWSGDVDGERADFDLAETRYFVNLARKYHIPLPETNKQQYWERNEYSGRRTLTTEGIDYVENRFLEKRKKKWEFWLAFVAPLTGLIGAIIGLIAIAVHAIAK